MKDKNFNRNPEGINQHELRSDNEIQKIINKYPNWTKTDFTGRGKLNSNKKNALLTRTEADKANLIFGQVGKRKKALKEIYKLSSKENIINFENKEITEDTFRDRARRKSYRDKQSPLEKKKNEKLKYKNLTDKQLERKRERNRNYIKNLSGVQLEKRKMNESKRQKERWANMTEAEQEIKRERDRKYQDRKAKTKRKERFKIEKN